MAEGLSYLGIVVLLVTGSGGWGNAVVRALRRLGWEAAPAVVRPPLQISLGMALFLAVGGVLVALDLAWFWVLVAWHLIGVGLLGRALLDVARRRAWPRLPPLVSSAALGAVAIVVVLLSLAYGVTVSVDNMNDDDGAYIYLAQRLLHTGGLIDPFNFRRLTSYGGSTLYQSLFLRVGGFSALHGFESTFAVLVLLVLAVGTFERRWVALGTLVLGVELLIGYGTGPVVNLSPTYSVAVLSLSVYQLLRRARAPDGAHPLLFAVIGVYSAGIVALRFYFLIPVVLAVVAVAWVTRPGRWVRPVAVVVGTTVVGSLGWMAASWRASGTPLFSVLPGNLGPGVPTGSDPLVHGLTPYLRLFGDVFHVDAVGVVAVLAVVVGVVLLRRRPGQAPEAAVLVFSGLGCLLELVVLTVVFSGSDVNDLVRFEAPSTLACALVVIDVVWPLRPGAATVPAAPVVPTAGARASRRERLVPAATAGFLVLFALVAFGVDTTRIDHAPRLVRTGTQVLTGAGFGNPYRSLDADYARLNAMIPTGARVLAAVDKPALLDYSRYTFATLDVPGYTSPPPHLPVFASVADQVAYLRHLGYDFVAVESPTDLGLYSEGQWLNEVRVRGYYYRAWSVYYLAWQQTVQGLETDGHYAVRYAGPLALIRIG